MFLFKVLYSKQTLLFKLKRKINVTFKKLDNSARANFSFHPPFYYTKIINFKSYYSMYIC